MAGEDRGKSEEQKLRERKTKVRYEGATRMNTRRGERWRGRWRVRSMGNRRGDRERERNKREKESAGLIDLSFMSVSWVTPGGVADILSYMTSVFSDP